MRRLNWQLASILALAATASLGRAQVIGFEDFAPPGSLVNVNPTAPYDEAGYRFTPANPSAAVFDSASGTTMPGNATDFFGFAGGNPITLTNPGGLRFNLNSLLIGPSSLAQSIPTNINLTGTLFSGGSLFASFSSLTTATTANLNWADLTSVTIFASIDSGIDNVVVSPAPEPTSLCLITVGLLAGWRGARRSGNRRSASPASSEVP